MEIQTLPCIHFCSKYYMHSVLMFELFLVWALWVIKEYVLLGNGNINVLFSPLPDPRVEHYPLLGGHPWPTVVILLLYLWFVYQGPSFMAKKQPMNLKSFLLIYNFGLILLSGFMFYEVSITILSTPISVLVQICLAYKFRIYRWLDIILFSFLLFPYSF